MKSRIAMTAVLLAWSLVSAGCGKAERGVKFDPYDTGAVTMAHNLAKPIVIYATADW